jgi:radical SAM-linked protein
LKVGRISGKVARKMQANYVQRLRLTFSKTGPTRFIGHLDLARTLERALNRAQIPLSYSQGFNQRPRMQLAAALPLGYTSDYELADIWLTEALPAEVARARMMARMAPGITIHQVEEVPLAEPPLQTVTADSTYVVTLLDEVDVPALQQRIAALLAADSHHQERRGKPYDLRPLIIDLSLAETADGPPQLLMRLYLMEGKTGRPDEVLIALGLDPLAARIHRTAIRLLARDAPVTAGH